MCMLHILVLLILPVRLSNPALTITPYTVCEALSNLSLYNGKMIALVGRISMSNEGQWLGEECASHLTTGDYAWPNLVWLEHDPSSETAQQADFTIDEGALRAKFESVLRSTKLRNQHDHWALVYGRLETRERLETVLSKDGKTKHGYGFGHLAGAPAQIVYRKKDVRVFSDQSVQELLKK